MTDPFRAIPWKTAQRSIAEDIWQLHDFAARSADPSRVSRACSLAKTHFAGDDQAQDLIDKVSQTSYSDVVAAGDADEHSLDNYVLAFGRLIARVADIKAEWQLQYVDELSKGFFVTRRILRFHQESARGETWFSWAGTEKSDGTPGALVQRALWKESVRAKNYLAAGVELVRDLPRSYRVALKREVLIALEMLRRAEKAGFGHDANPVIGWYHRSQIEMQARFGRATFKS